MAGYNITREAEQLGEHLRAWRMVLSMTAQQVCDRADISSSL